MLRCVEPYAPPGIKVDQNLLVVDALLNGDNGEANVRLSRTIPLSEPTVQRPELAATVSIETLSGNTFFLTDINNNGHYYTTGISVLTGDQYKLKVITQDNKQYQSEYIELKETPPIDSISWKPAKEGIDIFVNTHDNKNEVHFYRWEFSESWAYNSAFQSLYEFNGDFVVDRSNNIYNCFQNFNSSNILVKSTSNLSEGIVSEFPITFIPKKSERLFIRYSILIKQYSLTKDAYDFWELLKKNTESLGGLFDPLPSQLTGNIQSVTNTNEVVLGYFSASGVTEKRIFISLQDLPDGYRFTNTYPQCKMDTVFISDLPSFNRSGSLLISGYYAPGLVGYFYSINDCADCRLQSGTTQKPIFW